MFVRMFRLERHEVQRMYDRTRVTLDQAAKKSIDERSAWPVGCRISNPSSQRLSRRNRNRSIPRWRNSIHSEDVNSYYDRNDCAKSIAQIHMAKSVNSDLGFGFARDSGQPTSVADSLGSQTHSTALDNESARNGVGDETGEEIERIKTRNRE